MVSEWAIEETDSADLGDPRRNRRFAILLSAIGNRPNLSIPGACNGRAEMGAAYRFTDNKHVSFDKLLAPHSQCTLRRVAEHKVVLFVNDTTEVDLTRPEQQVAGVGELDGSRLGVLAHLAHAFTADGIPLGTLWSEVLNRPQEQKIKGETAAEKQRRRKQTPIEEKESMRWLTGLRKTRQAAEQLPNTQCICVADSEADIYELLAEPRGTEGGPQVDWLFRACQERALEIEGDSEQEHEPRRLRQAVMATPVLYELSLLIRGREAKTQVEERARRQSRDSRQAKMEVRAKTVRLRAPWRPDRTLPAVTVNVVMVREVDAPPGEAPVEWVLLTTLPIGTIEQVKQVVEYYCVRWNIEILFRTLKSGCRIEERRFEHVDRMERALALYLIVAWRTMFVCWMGRECPDLDCEAIFEPSEWKAVWVATQRKKPPRKRPKLKEMVILIAQLGGYVLRKKSEPGTQTVWIGMQRMYDLALAWDAFGPGAKISER